ncbi:hypothetical protein BB561_005759 [Smittium simulii]|uniref:Bacterial surface antigen (D15) domain-containing protein n=1 Tax=Smittium simulii TaxID=133385 RepID=A0A2T9Y8F0_9FUNG|nr:hypothetical protein BB561_005759 [Smittium simulii]
MESCTHSSSYSLVRLVNPVSSTHNTAGHTLKSSLIYNYEIDTSDRSDSQKSSYRFKLYSEVAGLGGDVLFSKNQIDFKSDINIYKRFSITSVMRMGAIFPLFNQSTSITDRFFLGGPMSLRGVLYRGMGPFDKTNCLGGDIFGIASLSLLAPLPFVKSRNFCSHFWLNSGSLAILKKDVPYSEQALSLLQKPTIVGGAGIAYKLNNLQLELNYCLPISAFETDKLKKGFQFTLGLMF